MSKKQVVRKHEREIKQKERKAAKSKRESPAKMKPSNRNSERTPPGKEGADSSAQLPGRIT
jgi:hypothetical protein